jgi:hypothetical protein
MTKSRVRPQLNQCYSLSRCDSPNTERQGVEVRAESFNLPNLVSPLADANTGRISSPLFGKITVADDPRNMLFALNYIF